MDTRSRGRYIDHPARYEIQVQGRLREGWSHWFGGMTVRTVIDEQGVPVTVLAGDVQDQAALHGLLARVRDLGLPLLLVQLLPPGQEEAVVAGSAEEKRSDD
jgi:hypothetical protein